MGGALIVLFSPVKSFHGFLPWAKITSLFFKLIKLLKSNPLLSIFNSYLVDAPAPSNLSYLWNYGSLLGLCLVIQIITGVTLAMHYTPTIIQLLFIIFTMSPAGLDNTL